jgi:hypothetical protein
MVSRSFAGDKHFVGIVDKITVFLAPVVATGAEVVAAKFAEVFEDEAEIYFKPEFGILFACVTLIVVMVIDLFCLSFSCEVEELYEVTDVLDKVNYWRLASFVSLPNFSS